MMLTPDNLGVVDLAVGDGHHNIASGLCLLQYLALFNTLMLWLITAWVSDFVMLMLRLQKNCARDKKLENS